jgi:lipopolysaccharide/colanic/teichoic acid biosynthesis glycosyltransferase
MVQLAESLRAGGRRSVSWSAPRWGLLAKRAIDVALASLALVVLLPVMVLVWLAIRLTSRGPAIFRQERLGQDARPFVLLKFRTMRSGSSDALHRRYITSLLTEAEPEAGGARGLFKLENDPRITAVGSLLRRTSADELPQLINVLVGQMSIVGPRPVLGWEAEHFDDTERMRFAVRPGLTGLWQVSGRNRLSMRQALELDVEYVRRQRLTLDLWIMVRTVPTLLGREAS